MKICYFLLIIALTGCYKQPYSNDYIYTKKDDHLSLQGKVNILRKSADMNDDASLTSIALLYAQNKNWVEAKYSISKAIKLNPLNPSYHLYLANFNAELNNNIEAYNEAKVAYELGTYDKKLEALLARMAVETFDTINGTEFVLKFYQSNQYDLEAQLLMARLHLIKKNYVASEQLLKIVLAKDSLHKNAIEVVHKVYKKLDKTELAIESGHKLINIDSTNALYHYQVAELYITKKEFNKAAHYLVESYRYKPLIETLHLALRNYYNLGMFDSVLLYTDSIFSGINYMDKEVLVKRARALDKRYKYEESYMVYNRLIKIDSTDSVVVAEREIVQRKIAYLWRKKREQKQLADSLANSMPIINF